MTHSTYKHPVLTNFGFIQQYNRHLLDNARIGKDTCSCTLYCAENARYSKQIASVK